MTRWGKSVLSVCAVLILVFGVTAAQAELIKFDVIPAFAPQGPQSPSWNGYVLNAIGGIQSEVNVGDRNVNPKAYERVMGPIPPEELMYTDFNSWRGDAAPTPLPAGFGGESGNRFHFGLHIVAADGTQFALNDLSWALDSDDSTDYFDNSGIFAGATYTATRVGIDYGADGQQGGSGPDADTILNAGQAGTTMVNELIYVGVGDGFYASEPGMLTDQEQIDITVADLLAGCSDPTGCFVDVTATYTLAGDNPGMGTGNLTIFLVPEPSSVLLALLGLVAVAAQSRRRR